MSTATAISTSPTNNTIDSMDAPAPPMPAPDNSGPERRVSMLNEEENYAEPETLQEELNEILDAFYEMVSDEGIQAYQRYVEDIIGDKIAEQALQEPEMAPAFALTDQDGDSVVLQDLLQKGPVVLVFYRGKWCPHCNATLMRYGKHLVPALKQYNATLVAISPMLPDGTAYLASKRDLGFSVCSDFNNSLAQEFRITFTVQPHTRPFMTLWGEDVPKYNGIAESWEIPLPATYIIEQDGRVAWSFLDNDPGIRAEPKDILREVAAISTASAMDPLFGSTTGSNSNSSEHHQRGTHFRDDAQSTCSHDSNNSSNKKHSSKQQRRKSMFNRRISSTFKPASLRIRFSWKGGTTSRKNNNSDDNHMDHPSEDFSPSEDFQEEHHHFGYNNNHQEHESDHFSVRSEQQIQPKRRTPRKPFRAQSAKEFLGKYMAPPS